MTRLKYIDIIDRFDAEQLKAAGVTTIEQLLELGASRAGRMRLADQTNIPEQTILQWIYCADLMRVTAMNLVFIDMVRSIGINSPSELAHYSSRRLLTKLAQLSLKNRTTRYLPTREEIESMIAAARNLPKYVSY